MNKSTLKRAMCVTDSWVRSWGLETSVEKGHLVVAGQVITFVKGQKGLLVNPTRILSQDQAKVQAELRELAKKLQVTPPPPPRAIESGHRAAADDYLARSMRLTAFARSANPTDQVFEKYRATIKREADCAHARYHYLATKMSFRPEDFLSIAMTLAVPFFHRKADPTNEKRTGALLTGWLRQEFARWARATTKDLQNIVPDPQGMEVADFMGRPVPGADLAHNLVEGFYVMPEYHQPEPECPEEDENVIQVRRTKAKAELSKALGEMPHDHMVSTLFDVATSIYQDVAARELAGKLLKTHAAGCPHCRTTVGG